MAVIRGYILPKRGADNTPVYAEVIDESRAKMMFEELIDIIKGVLDTFTSRGEKKIKDPEELSLFLDSLVAYFKSLMFMDPIPLETADKILLPAPPCVLYLYLSQYDRYTAFKEKDAVPYKKDGLNELEKELKEYLKEIANLYTEEKRKKFYEILSFPADTRPGANTSSLLIHALTTSALATVYYINKRGIDENLLVIRLSAIFHDIGKLLNWRRHEERSGEEMRSLFEKYVDGKAREIVLKAYDLIKNSKHPLREFLSYGDRKASELDRVVSLFDKVIRESPLYEEFKDRIEKYARDKGVKASFEEAFMEWSFWVDYVGEDLVKKLTEEFCKRASMISKENPVFMEEGKIVDENVVFVRIDLRGIQRFVKTNNIWAMNGASRLVDLILYVAIPAYLVDNFKVPLENVLYFGGGNATIVFPRKLNEEKMEKIYSFVDHFNNEFFKDSQSKIIFGTSPLYNVFRSINSEIDREIAVKKIAYEDYQELNPNIYEKCEFCATSFATQLSDKGDFICDLCKRKYEFGEKWHFRVRVRANFLELKWETLSKYVLEYIAGHSEEGPKPEEEYLDLAMVKFDGILIGQMMSSSISLTDACERSFRIDFSVKEAIRGFMKKLLNLNKDDFNRIVLGLMYVGGDDGVVLLPSRLSIPFALYLMNEYYLNMGCRSALAVGIIAAKPKHPLIHLYEACDVMLNIAKRARKDCYENLHKIALTTPSEVFRGSIAFLTTNGGWATSESVGSIIEEAWNEGISRMRESYYLSGAQNSKSILKLLNIIENENKIELKDISLERLLEIVWINKEKEEDKISKFKKVRDIVYEIFASSQLESRKMEFIYVARESKSAQDKMKKNIMKEILSQAFYKIDHIMNTNLYDLLVLVKLLGGGKV